MHGKRQNTNVRDVQVLKGIAYNIDCSVHTLNIVHQEGRVLTCGILGGSSTVGVGWR